MNIKVLTLFTLFAAALAIHPAVKAADTTLAIEQMARIMIDLKGKPGEDAKMTLDDIAEDTASTYNERILASSIKHMDKKIRPDDKPTVLKIWTSPAASETEREMAKILLRFNEKPTDDIKGTLSQWVER